MATILQQILFGKRLELKSILSKTEVIQRLEDNHCNPKWNERPNFHYAFVGEVKADRFRLSRLKNIGSSIAPLLSGRVLEAAKGSLIEVKIRLHPVVLIGIFLIGGLIIGAGGVLLGFSGLDQLIDLIAFIPILMVFLILYVVVRLLLDESKQAELELEELLDCEMND
jgi:hypothetical protein